MKMVLCELSFHFYDLSRLNLSTETRLFCKQDPYSGCIINSEYPADDVFF